MNITAMFTQLLVTRYFRLVKDGGNIVQARNEITIQDMHLHNLAEMLLKSGCFDGLRTGFCTEHVRRTRSICTVNFCSACLTFTEIDAQLSIMPTL